MRKEALLIWVGERFGFVCSVRVQGLKITKACRLYGISRPTGYEWLKRFDISPERLLKDRSRRPHHTPNATPGVVSQKILDLWDESGWDAKKIQSRLSDLSLPSPSVPTINRSCGGIDVIDTVRGLCLKILVN